MAQSLVIDFDFTQLEGGKLRFETARDFLAKLDNIKLDPVIEARYLSGKSILDGVTALFQKVKTKKTSVKATRDLATEFRKALNTAIPSGLSNAFKNFLKALTDKGVKVYLVSRCDPKQAETLFGSVLSDSVTLLTTEPSGYDFIDCVSCMQLLSGKSLTRGTVTLMLGTGPAVKAALQLGLRSIAVIHDHVAYQDFTGANAVLNELSGKTAKKVLDYLHIA